MIYISRLSCLVCIITVALHSITVRADDHKNEKEHPHSENTDLSELSEEAVKQLNIPIAKAESGSVDSHLVLFGKIDLHPEKALHLHSKYPGIVRDVYKSVGDRVKAGDVLARVENNVGVQSSDLAATISGIIIEKKIAAGQSINEEVEAFTVADMSTVMATLIAYPRDINKISLGQKILLQSTKSGPIESAEISYISPLLDDKTRTAKVQVFLKNESGLWRSGQFVIGKTVTGKRNISVRIPNDVAFKDSVAATKLYVKDGSRFVLRSINISEGDSSYAEVTSGVVAGEEYLGLNLEKIEDVLKKKAGNADSKK